MINFSVFWQTFYLCFLVLISVGPVFLTTANIAMTRGYKAGLFCILGCIFADFIFITLGVFCAKAVISALPKVLIMLLSLCAACYLLYIAFNFWKSDVSKLKSEKINKTGFSLSVKMACLTLSSPLSIAGYGAIFSSIIGSSEHTFSSLFGGYFAAIFTHILIMVSFATIGKKLNVKVLSILNKLSAILISGFAFLLIANFIKELIK